MSILPKREPWEPLPGADANPVVSALSESDRRADMRHVEQLATQRWVLGGAGVIVLACVLILGGTRGISPASVADGVVPIVESVTHIAQAGTPTPAPAPAPDPGPLDIALPPPPITVSHP